MQDEKHFDEWMDLKSALHYNAKIPKFKEGDVWWCGIGENVGVEINGKSDRFSRPVIIYKKLSRYGFMGISLTTQKHEGTWYVSFEFQGRQERAVLSQVRTFSVSRLYKQLGALSDTDFDLVRQAFDALYCTKNVPQSKMTEVDG